MATAPLGAESVPTNPKYFVTFPGVPLVFSNEDRDKLASFVEVAMAFLDAIDGDPDLEDSDGDAQCTEDDQLWRRVEVLDEGV